MSGIMGYFKRTTSEDTYINTIGQNMVFTAALEYVTKINEDIAASMAVMVAGDTEDYKWMYRLPGGGRMAKRAPGTTGPAVRPFGNWEVALPLEDFDAMIAADEVDWAYMTVGELQLYLDNIQIQYVNALRFEMWQKIWKNTNTTFTDRLKGSLTVVPIANGDTVVYPPVTGSETEATEDHFLESGYVATAISDTNNPFPVIYKDLVHHYTDSVGGSQVLVFIHSDEKNEVEALTSFTEVPDADIRSGDNVDVPTNLPMSPGRIIGKSNNCWISEYDWMPTGYMFGVYLNAPAPLSMRVDPAATGLPRGLSLRSGPNTNMPFEGSRWGARFGLGVTNRLNGVAMELAAGGTYTIPTDYD